MFHQNLLTPALKELRLDYVITNFHKPFVTPLSRHIIRNNEMNYTVNFIICETIWADAAPPAPAHGQTRVIYDFLLGRAARSAIKQEVATSVTSRMASQAPAFNTKKNGNGKMKICQIHIDEIEDESRTNSSARPHAGAAPPSAQAPAPATSIFSRRTSGQSRGFTV
ncbi:hypothetical protein EVAR_31201_1 [Eumeta japonica]|uniref:Uncharacterized protein n=1 Tax=Eumeta variegata TaxID=151549 RepID=A0A4C1VZQ1_EUMVA|nr:hypothetical protein EVAR_31201_1 [Eumeta japonica]